MTRKSKQHLQLEQPSTAAKEPPVQGATRLEEPPVLRILRVAEFRQMILRDNQLTFKDKLNLALASSSVFFATVDILCNVQQEAMYYLREQFPRAGSKAATIFAAYRNAAEHLRLKNDYHPARLELHRFTSLYPQLQTVEFHSLWRYGTSFTIKVRHPNPEKPGLPLLTIDWWNLENSKWIETINDWQMGVVNNPKYRLWQIIAPTAEREYHSIEKAFASEETQRALTQRALEHVEIFEGDIPARVLLRLLPMPSLRELRFRVEDHQIDPTALFIKLSAQPKLEQLRTNFQFYLALAAMKTSHLRVERFACSADSKWCRKENQSGVEPGTPTQWTYSAVLGQTIEAAWQYDSPVKKLIVYFGTPPTLDVHHVALLIRSRAPWCEINISPLKEYWPYWGDESILDAIWDLVQKKHYATKASLLAAGFGPWLKEEP